MEVLKDILIVGIPFFVLVLFFTLVFNCNRDKCPHCGSRKIRHLGRYKPYKDEYECMQCQKKFIKRISAYYD